MSNRKENLHKLFREMLNECAPPTFDEYGVPDYLAGPPNPNVDRTASVENLKRRQAESAAKRELGIVPGSDEDKNFTLNENKKVMKITPEQLQQIIKEGVEKLHKKALIESRIEQINQELNRLNNPEAWEEARKRAQEELEKKTLNWRSITERPNGIINENFAKNMETIQKWIDKYDYRGAAKKIIDSVLMAKTGGGLSSSDMGDTVTFANGLDNVEEFLIAGEFENAIDSAKETANEMIEEESGGMFFESAPSAGLSKKKKSDVVKKAKAGEDIGKKGKGFKDVAAKAKESGADDPEAVAAAAMWKNIKRESVADIMERASKLMEEARQRYNEISKKD